MAAKRAAGRTPYNPWDMRFPLCVGRMCDCRVRWWRGSGLRMMPTFPPPPLSFRTAGFPQYGWKVGLSGSAFPHVAQVKPAPGMPCTSCRFASALRALRGPSGAPLCVGTMDSVMHRHSRSWLLYPRGPRSGLGCSIRVHPRLIDLIRPTRRHIPISPYGDLYGMPSLCWCA
jgi:hypothetical protein